MPRRTRVAPDRATTGLPTMTVAQLPSEGVDTLGLIAAGGPFPYSKDGVTFQNREGILPPQRSGFYQEYTVQTPGSSDRGARRIISGQDGSRFYTDDHYDSVPRGRVGGRIVSARRLSRLDGVRRVDAPVDELENAAEELGWRCVVLDGAEVEDKDAFLELCAESFALPEWFGMNWDALEECLGDLDLGGVQGVAVLWTGWGQLAEEAARDFAVAVDIFAGAVRGWHRDGVTGGVLLVGEGPDVEIDEL